MPRLQGGDMLRLAGSAAESSSGCLVRFASQPQRLLLLGCAHGLVRKAARQGDLVEAVEAPARPLGRLWTWTTLRSVITADVALVWVDPGRVSAEIGGLGAISAEPNLAPRVGDGLRMKPRVPGDAPRRARISRIDEVAPLDAVGPDWSVPGVSYAGQIVCEPMFTRGGDSGAVVVGDDGRLVGMVVGARPLIDLGGGRYASQTVITPIASILAHPDFAGDRLEIVAQVPVGLASPELTAAG